MRLGVLGVAAALCTALVLACAKPPHPAVVRARSAWEKAIVNPRIDRQDSLQLLEAEEELESAEQAARKGREEQAAHYAYLAETRIRIAELTADTAAANEEAAKLAAERPKPPREARGAEADAATARGRDAEREARPARKSAALPAGELRALEARQTERGAVVTLDGALFEPGSADLEPDAARKLSRLAGFLIAHPDRAALVEGYADPAGPDPVTQPLAAQRAEAVRRYLEANGVAIERMASRGYGPDHWVEQNAPAEGRSSSLRLEVTILPPGVAASSVHR